jgi:SAM-dependent methyltransferase
VILSVPRKSECSASPCWVCGSTGALPWKERSIQRPLQPEDLQITDYRYGTTLSLLRCRECGFIFSDDKDVVELVSLYERMSDPGYERSQEGRALQMQWLLNKARLLKPQARTVLDVGAGAGLLVVEARRLGLDAVGVEPSHSLVRLGRQLYNIDLIQGVFPHCSLADRTFDLIFLVDIIEHVSNPVELLAHCALALSPIGIIVLVTPNVRSLVARILGRRWWHFRLAHVGYFSPPSLAIAARRGGLTVVDQFSAKWFFRFGYLSERLESYLPIAGMNRLASKLRPLEWFYNRVVPLNVHDSVFVILRKTYETSFQTQ